MSETKPTSERCPVDSLARRECVPCRGGTPALEGEALARLYEQLDQWELIDGRRIRKTWKFADFAGALAFVDRVGALAEQQRHHPDIRLSWGKATIELHTHKIGGLSESDFILAAKIDQLDRD